MKKKFIPVFLLTFVNVLGFSILMPVLPFVVESYGAPKWIYGLLITFYAAFQFLGASYLGTMSDSKGRKPILLLSQAGTLLAWCVFLGAIYLPSFSVFGMAFPLYIIGLARILDGVTGGNSSVANAYLADITTREEKSYIFGYLGGVVGIGMIVGPAIGGFTASSSLGYKGTLLASIFISVLTFISIFIWLKESHPKEKRIQHQRLSLWQSVFILKKIKETNPSNAIKLLFLLKFVFSVMAACYMSTIALFIIDVFDYNEQELGCFMLIVGLFLAFNQAVVARAIIKKVGEVKTLLLGFVLCFAGCFLITLTHDIYVYCVFYYVFNLGVSLCFPTFNALIAIHTDAKKQGEVMGINESILSLCMAIFPVMAASSYAVLQSRFYYLLAILPLLCLSIALMRSKEFKTK